MPKVYYISESKFKELVEIKKIESDTLKKISEELDQKKATLTEAKLLNEGIIDVVKKYWRSGLLTAGILASLLGAQKVDAQQLLQAGIPTELVQQAQQKVKFNPSEMTNNEIESRLVKIMKKNGLDGSLKSFNQLNPQQKENVLNGIRSQIKSLDDINQITIGDWSKYAQNNPNAIQFDQQSSQKITVETVDSVATVPVQHLFVTNSFKIANPENLKQDFTDLIQGFTQIDKIEIIASSSTARNTGEAEGMTWKELSQARGEAVANLLIGQKIDLGGENKNTVGEITSQMITINSNGTNGDGTSGPKSPYEVSPEYIQSYKERGIDPKLWQSAAKDDALPLERKNEYNQYQYVIVKIYGRVVTTQTEEVPSYRYVILQVNKFKGDLKTGQDKKTQDISKCSVKVKKVKMNNTGS